MERDHQQRILVAEESIDDEDKYASLKEPLLDDGTTNPSKTKGGLRTLPFIIGNEAFERAAYYGLEPNMIKYMMGGYGLEMPTGANIIFLWNAAANFTPIFGAFLADTCVGRFRMIGFGSIVSFMGMLLLWLTTIVPGARPSCDNVAANKSCLSSTPFQLILLCTSLGLMAIGTGGIRSSTLAFGSDQVVNAEEENATTPSKNRLLESFFNWYYMVCTLSVVFALTCIVYIQDHMGWKVGFGVPVVFMLFSAIFFYLASSFYVKAEPKPSLLTGLAQVLVASWRNRHYELSSRQSTTERVYHVTKGSTLQSPTEKLRFYNKACIVKDHEQEITTDGIAINPWHLCTVDQVEEFKSIINILPLWSTGIIVGVNANQSSFRLLQANSMDRHVFSQNFEIPAGSFGTFALISVILWLFLYDRMIIPLVSKALGKPFHLDVKTRIGIGILLSCVCLVVSGVVESVRRDMATRKGETMSALWLAPQVCLLGLAEALFAIGQIEFLYSEFPKSMSCIASNLYGVSMGIASLAASFFMSLVNHVTKGSDGKESWVTGDLNKGHYDYYYWVLAGLNLLNYMYFLVCSRAYGPVKNKIFHATKEIGDA